MDETLADGTILGDQQLEPLAPRWQMFLFAIAFFLADLLLIDVAARFQIWAGVLSALKWNWFGKTASILFCTSVLAWSPWLRQNVGLRWRQSSGSLKLSLGCCAAFLACAIAIGSMIPRVSFSVETLLFQFFIPGNDEELMVRGMTLALLERAFGQSPMSYRLRFGYASLIVSLAFGLPHAVGMTDGQFQFSFVLFATTTAWAAIVTLVRTRSGSLLRPVVLHGIWDGTIFLVAMLR
jgi:membrane protease YdiL (CAAX protease family)